MPESSTRAAEAAETGGTEFRLERDALEVVMSRTFDASRELVFRAYTEPELFARWWGPSRYENRVEKMENRPGGEWRVVQVAPDGGRHVFFGVTREIVPPERIVATFEYEPWAEHVVVNTAEFEDLGARTRLTVRSRYASLEDLEGMIRSGMEEGARESWERLAELLSKIS